METGGITVLLGILLGLVLMLGSCVGVDTSQLEQVAGDYGIEPVALPGGDQATQAEDTSFDDVEFETEWTIVETAQEGADAAGIGSFPDFATVDTGYGEGSIYYFYKEGCEEALCLYSNDTVIAISARKAIYDGVDDIAEDDRTFAASWTEEFAGVKAQCFGDSAGAPCKVVFVDGDYAYSIVSMGPDDDINRAMTPECLTVIVSALLK